MYYKSLFEQIKDELADRVEILEEYSDNGQYYIKITIKPKDINICPSFNSTEIIKFGKKERCIKDDYISNRTTFIHIQYNRLKCKKCLSLFNDSIPYIDGNKSISLALKLNVIEDLRQDVSFTYIASKRNISIQTVIDIFETYINYERNPFGDVLCMDEFKNLRHSNGKYAFVIYDPNTHKIIDILEDRLQAHIDDYLYKIDWKEKDKVKYIVTDMSESYRSIIKRHFRNATHVIDCFHYFQYVEKAFNDVRIRIQKKYSQDSKEYRILKRYWRILSTYCIDVEGESLYNPIRKKSTSVEQIITDATSLDDELLEAYEITQDFINSVKSLKYEDASTWIDTFITSLKESKCAEFNDLAGMFINWKAEIINSFIRFGDKRLHNGYLEGMNNKIKVIKRIAYGYTNFYHFRNRIMHIVNEENFKIKIIDKTKIKRKKRKK